MGGNKFAQRGGGPAALAEYKFYTEFQSHEPEFDYLKSLEIEEKVRLGGDRGGNTRYWYTGVHGYTGVRVYCMGEGCSAV